MEHSLYPGDLTDRQWDCIQLVLPKANLRGRPRTHSLRRIINALMYVVRTGCQWRMLPKEYPPWPTVYYYFARWRDNGVWKRIHDTLRAALREHLGRHKHPTAGSMDSQSVPTAGRAEKRGFDAGKHIKGRKRHVLVDTLGLLLGVQVTSAAISDVAGARQLWRQLGGVGKRLHRVWVDGTYRGPLVDWVLSRSHCQITPMVRPPGQKGFTVIPKRWAVERTFGWFSSARRLRVDYEVLVASAVAIIYLVMIRLMLRRLAA
jgi:putative transposase